MDRAFDPGLVSVHWRSLALDHSGQPQRPERSAQQRKAGRHRADAGIEDESQYGDHNIDCDAREDGFQHGDAFMAAGGVVTG
jgi:hypothetical protein